MKVTIICHLAVFLSVTTSLGMLVPKLGINMKKNGD